MSLLEHIGFLVENGFLVAFWTLEYNLLTAFECICSGIIEVSASQKIELSFVALDNIEILWKRFVELEAAIVLLLSLR